MRILICALLVALLMPGAAAAARAEHEPVAAQPSSPDQALRARAARLARAGAYAQAVQLLRRRLAERPDDREARFLLARVLSWQQRYDEAMRQYVWLLQRDPDNLDYLFGKAQVLAWTHRYTPALSLLETLRARAPAFEDAWRLEWQILTTPGVDVGKIDREAFRTAAARAFPHRDWWRPRPRAPKPAEVAVPAHAPTMRELELGASLSLLNHGFANWHGEYLALRTQLANGAMLHGSLAQEHRYGLRDHRYLFGLSWPLTDRWTALAEGQFSPTHRFLPSSSLFAAAHLALPAGWGAQIGARQSHYPTAQSWVSSGMIERYFADYRASYTLNLVRVLDAGTGANHVFTLDRYFADGGSIGLAYTIGQEVERVSPTRVAVTPVWNLTARGRYWWHAPWGVVWSLHFHHQGHLYNRMGGHLGLLYRF